MVRHFKIKQKKNNDKLTFHSQWLDFKSIVQLEYMGHNAQDPQSSADLKQISFNLFL